ncbi:hypothetical protein Vafri_14963 [Volvox africanus]|nr:hypothetical protein Vafri_14963 [Volvox africanus]
MAPEVIRATDQYAGQAADIWSCGVMLYVMLFGAYPFESPQSRNQQGKARMDSMMQRILRMEWSIPADVEVSPEGRDLLCKLLVGDPRHRLTMSQIQSHPWFLTNIPPDASAMNDNFLAHTDYTGVQSEDDIKRVLASAAIPAPASRFAFGAAGYDDNYEDLDAAIDDEMANQRSAGPTNQAAALPAVAIAAQVARPPSALGAPGNGHV